MKPRFGHGQTPTGNPFRRIGVRPRRSEMARIPELPKLVQCVACGESNQVNWKQCWKCGRELPKEPADVR